MIRLNINTNASVVFTNKLEKLHRSALPLAIRGALNKAAFDVKQKTMPTSAKNSFIERQPNFFKANSRVEMAKGFDVANMRATVGMVSQNLKGENNYSVKDLEKQEHGGAIGGRSFVPTNAARGGSSSKNVRPNARLSGIKRIVDVKRSKAKTRVGKLIASAKEAGKGGFILTDEILFRVDSVKKTKSGQFKIIPLYSFKKGRKVRVKPTHFMESASLKSALQLERFFYLEALRQIKRLTGK